MMPVENPAQIMGQGNASDPTNSELADRRPNASVAATWCWFRLEFPGSRARRGFSCVCVCVFFFFFAGVYMVFLVLASGISFR